MRTALLLCAIVGAVILAGCTVSKTSSSTTTTNCSLNGCETTSHGTPAVGPAAGVVLLACAAIARRRATR